MSKSIVFTPLKYHSIQRRKNGYPLFEAITSLQNPRIKKAIRLFSSRGRQSQGRMIVFGKREIIRAVAAGVEFEEIFLKQATAESTVGELEFLQSGESGTRIESARVFALSDDVFAKISYGDRDEGIVGIAQRPSTQLSNIQLGGDSLVVLAQAIEKPGNVGAIARTADACGATAIILSDPLTDFFHPNAIRSSTGTIFSQQVATATSSEVQTWLEQNQFSVFVALLGGATDLFKTDLTGNCALVVGNEANGLSEEWSDTTKYVPVMLPMNGVADSLNASVTASVMLYEAFRQRKRMTDSR